MKIAIIGAGNLGAHLAYLLTVKNVVSEISLVDSNVDVALAVAEDILQCTSVHGGTKVYAGGYETCADADMVAIAIDIKGKHNSEKIEADEMNHFQDVLSKIAEFNKDCLLFIISSPVELLTYIAIKSIGFPRERVFGIGTAVTMVRLQSMLASFFHLNPQDCQCLVLGEIAAPVPITSSITVQGLPLAQMPMYAEKEIINIIKKSKIKESTSVKKKNVFTAASTAYLVLRSIVKNQHKIIPLSVLLQGEYGLKDVVLSVPVRINRSGIAEIIEMKLTEEEKKELVMSSVAIRSTIQGLHK